MLSASYSSSVWADVDTRSQVDHDRLMGLLLLGLSALGEQRVRKTLAIESLPGTMAVMWVSG